MLNPNLSSKFKINWKKKKKNKPNKTKSTFCNSDTYIHLANGLCYTKLSLF